MILFAISWAAASGQSKKVTFEKIVVDDGLASINAMIRDRHNFMWFGGTHGLYRFDGYDYRVFTRESGQGVALNSNHILSLFADATDKVWIGTAKGLNVYDPLQETIEHIDHPLLNGKRITSVAQDEEGNIWIATIGNGVVVMNESTNTFSQFRHVPSLGSSLSNDEVFCILKDSSGKMWVTTNSGSLDLYDSARHTFIHHIYSDTSFAAVRTGQRVIEDSFRNLWIGTEGRGLYRYNREEGSFKNLNAGTCSQCIGSGVVTDVREGLPGEIWFTTDGGGGLNKVSSRQWHVEKYQHDPYDRFSISNNSSYCLYLDRDGTIWTGMGDGVVNKSVNTPFTLLQPPLNPAKKGLSFRVVVALASRDNSLWIGTGGGGLDRFNIGTGEFTNYSRASTKNRIGSDIILDVSIDQYGFIWIGTFMGGLSVLDPVSGLVKVYKHTNRDRASLSNDHVFDVLTASDGSVWVGTQGGGVDCLDRVSQKFTHYTSPTSGAASSDTDRITCLMEDRGHNIWIGSVEGSLRKLTVQTGEISRIKFPTGVSEALAQNAIYSIFETRHGKMLIGTEGGGLIVFDPMSNNATRLTTAQGLPSNSIYGAVEDCFDNVWLSTNRGLARYETESGNVKIFNSNDGLPTNDFEAGAMVLLPDCRLFVACKQGIVTFLPEAIRATQTAYAVSFTSLRLFNEIVQPGEEVSGQKILESSVAHTRKIQIPYYLNNFALEFAAVGAANPTKIAYRYKLEGYSERWIETTSSHRQAAFTNLDPGTYTLIVEASTERGVWQLNTAHIVIEVTPPWWRSTLAKFFYILSAGLLIYIVHTLSLIRTRNRSKAEMGRYMLEKDREIFSQKLEFFTAVSHELRTPLTLIVAPLERLLHSDEFGVMARQQMLVMHRNCGKLLHLVNQLLDFRKIDSGKLTLQTSKIYIAELIDEMVFAFKNAADEKGVLIDLQYDGNFDVPVFVDRSKFEIILNNLIANALNYGASGGKIDVWVQLMLGPGRSTQRRRLHVSVKDYGPGIPVQLQEKIFEPFFRVNEQGGTPGTGLGLALVKDLVEMHHGKLTLSSGVNKGTTFTFLIPVGPADYDSSEIINDDLDRQRLISYVHSATPSLPLAGAPHILIAEDNGELRNLIREMLSVSYHVHDVPDGRQAFDWAVQHVPDLIISDVMMPHMDGISLSRRIKTDTRTSHIPFIVLTARTTMSHKLEGYESGVDDYITKPFDIDLLMTRIANLIENRRRFQQRIYEQSLHKLSESPNELFVKKLVEFIEQNLAEEKFSISALSRELGMSHSVLYKKVMALTGKSVNDFVKLVRSRHAAKLVADRELSIADISVRVGFNNPKYFSTWFRGEFGVSPSEYQKNATRA